jgi:hypothetical protein
LYLLSPADAGHGRLLCLPLALLAAPLLQPLLKTQVTGIGTTQYKYPVLKQAVFRISLSADSDPDPALGFSIAPEANILPFFFLCFANANLFISYYGTVP